jgi:tetratricopeptide (TPR) repeat protein
MRKARALLLGLFLILPAGGVTAAQLGYARASCLSETIAPIDAISSCTAVLQKFHSQAAVFVRRGVAFAELGAFDYAVGDFSRAIRLDPGNALAFALRGLAYELQGRLAESLQDYRQAQTIRQADRTVDAAIARVTRLMTPAPETVAAPAEMETAAPSRETLLALSVPQDDPAQAADGWLLALGLIGASAALAMRFGRRREETAPAA